MPSIVVTEIKATVLRHRFLDRLTGRIDIVAPDALSPSLARRLPGFLVAALDDAREPGTGGWPVFTGGRYPKLCFSPVLDGLDRKAGGLLPHQLPLTRAAYVDYVAAITGITPADFNDFSRVFRFDPLEIFDACKEMRRHCPPAWRLLVSNEFALAKELWPALGEPLAGSQFRYLLVDAFAIIAELERACIVMRHLARTRLLITRDRFLEILASSLPLSTWFEPAELIEVHRWIEYATFSSAALTDFLFTRDADGVAALPAGYAPRAIARGRMIGAAADFRDHPEVRKALARVFARPPLPGPKPSREKRKQKLRNDEVVRWYGMTAEMLPVIALDDVRKRYPGKRERTTAGARQRGVVKDHLRFVVAALGSAMRHRADPAMAAAIVGASEEYGKGSTPTKTRDVTLEENVKTSQHHAKTYLPAMGMPGAAARYDPAMWRTPGRDADLWSTILVPGDAMHDGLGRARGRDLRRIAEVMNRSFGHLVRLLDWDAEIERAVCDLAVAVGPISADPHIAYAVHSLGTRR